MNKKSIEQRLYEAWRAFKGIRLSEKDVGDLITMDDAIRTRISNTAALEAGKPEPGCDCTAVQSMTWKQLKDSIGT